MGFPATLENKVVVGLKLEVPTSQRIPANLCDSELKFSSAAMCCPRFNLADMCGLWKIPGVSKSPTFEEATRAA